MASSRKLRSVNLHERVATQIAPLLPAHSSILIGLSGGVDSVVLLHLLHKLAPFFSWRISALHVHHGISPNADLWSDFCTDLCASFNIPLQIRRVDIAPLREHGVEAAARKLRYAAFAGQACDFVALAHHADDQAETLLLQLLRGAGVRGASAMPVLSLSKRFALSQSERVQFIEHNHTLRLIRPLLHCSRQEIIDYAGANQLRWIEDESNSDDIYPRNFLRHRVLPLLGEKFPAYRDTLARSAQHFAEASLLLDELAQQDAEQAIEGATLSVQALQSLNPARAKNMLRYFLHIVGAPMPQAVQLDAMLRQLCDARRDASVCVNYGGWEVRRYLGRAYVLRASGEFDNSLVLPWQGEDELEWPALNARLRFERKQFQQVGPAMISMEKLQSAPVTLRFRCGGESLRPYPDAANRSLKNLLQEHRIPPWRRDRLPLLYCGEELVCVAGVAVSAGYLPGKGQAAIQFSISEY